MTRKFKLQKVLEYRELILEREKSRMAALAIQEQEILAEIRRMVELVKAKLSELSEAQNKGELDFILMYEKYITKLEKERRGLQEKLNRHRQDMHKQKGITVGAYQRKSIMDKLKDKHDREYQAFTEKAEQKSTEDIVLTRQAGRLVKETRS